MVARQLKLREGLTKPGPWRRQTRSTSGPTDESGCRWGQTQLKISRELTFKGTLAAQASQDESQCWVVNPLANHSTYQCVYHGWLYFGDEDLKGDESLGCGTAPKLWPRSPITKIQGLIGTPLSMPPCLPATGVSRGSTTDPRVQNGCQQGQELAIGIANLNPLNRRPGHTHTSPEESVQQYEITRIGIKDISNPTPILYVDSGTGQGIFPLWPCVSTLNVRSGICNCVESYAIHMILAHRLRITFTSNFTLIISLLVSRQESHAFEPNKNQFQTHIISFFVT